MHLFKGGQLVQLVLVSTSTLVDASVRTYVTVVLRTVTLQTDVSIQNIICIMKNYRTGNTDTYNDTPIRTRYLCTYASTCDPLHIRHRENNKENSKFNSEVRNGQRMKYQ